MRQKIYYSRPLVLAAGMAVILAGVPARAADVVGEEPPVPAAAPLENPPVNTWSGPYVGVSGAYVFGRARYSLPAAGSFATNGWYGNVFAGYDHQMGPVVIGIEGDIGYGSTSGGNGVASSRTRVDGTLRARLGYALTDDVLAYGTGGLAAARLTGEEGGTSQTRTVLGWTAGAGVQVKVTQSVFGRLEYRYTDFGNKTFATASGANTFSNRENKLLLGVGVKF
ncbi:MAG: porin family protein [Notoacmeibacter sp.]|nr:porin family protein [Notoacmeibacter sp.]